MYRGMSLENPHIPGGGERLNTLIMMYCPKPPKRVSLNQSVANMGVCAGRQEPEDFRKQGFCKVNIGVSKRG